MNEMNDQQNKNLKKKKNRLIFRSVVLVILFAAVVFALISSFNKEESVVEVSDNAPNFKLEQLNGEKDSLTLSDLEGKGVMLNFWATYCKPCEKEMPYMQELYTKYEEKGVEVVAVSVDATELVINRFIDQYGLTFPVVHDKGQVMELYGIGPLPSTFFINPEGKVEEKVIGPLTLSRLEGYLQQIQPE